MAQKKLNLDKIRDEIQARRTENYTVPSHLGESTIKGGAPRDEFLNGLIMSLKTGQETAASNLIKTVENSVAVKHGEVARHRINENVPKRPAHQRVEMSAERDEQLFADLEKRKNQTLAESIGAYTDKQNGRATPSTVNYGNQEYLTSAPQGSGGQINEAALISGVKDIVNTHLSENLGPIFEEAIKGTIIEMYALEQIQKVLNENRDLIKSVVIETIREIQQKNKVKAQ